MYNKEVAELTIDVLEALKKLGPGLMIGEAAEYGIKALKVQEPIMRCREKQAMVFRSCGRVESAEWIYNQITGQLNTAIIAVRR